MNDYCWYSEKCKQRESSTCNNCIRKTCMNSLFSKSLVPESLWKYKDLICGDADTPAFEELSLTSKSIGLWVQGGYNLYIFSEYCGNGKTSWAIRLLFKWFDSIWHKSGFDCHGLFINVPKFLYDHKRNINAEVKGFEELCNLISTVELVIWDDLPTRTLTEYEHQILLQFIDDRMNSGLSNIITGNCNRVECSERIGERLTSRIFGNSRIIEFKEGDKRGWTNG